MTNPASDKHWLVLYREAVLESDPKRLKTRIAQAQHAIRKRVLDLWYGGSHATGERRELDAASNFLGLLLTFNNVSRTKAAETTPL